MFDVSFFNTSILPPNLRLYPLSEPEAGLEALFSDP
jgi:hypothetical protein